MPAIDAVEMIEPPPRSSRYGRQCFMPSQTPFRLMAITRSKSSSVASPIDPSPKPMPALL